MLLCLSWTTLQRNTSLHRAARPRNATHSHQAWTVQVLAWDVRGGAGVLGMHRHPQLAAVSLRGALARVPGLMAETAVSAASVASLVLDPQDPSRIAFHLSSGWSGAPLGTTPLAMLHMRSRTPAQPCCNTDVRCAVGSLDSDVSSAC